jgi:hypothetical protein
VAKPQRQQELAEAVDRCSNLTAAGGAGSSNMYEHHLCRQAGHSYMQPCLTAAHRGSHGPALLLPPPHQAAALQIQRAVTHSVYQACIPPGPIVLHNLAQQGTRQPQAPHISVALSRCCLLQGVVNNKQLFSPNATIEVPARGLFSDVCVVGSWCNWRVSGGRVLQGGGGG